MSLTPWNRQEEWYQQMINAATGKYLPSVDAEDAGKVLTVGQDGSWEADAIPQELPTVEETDKDKFLHTNGTTGDLEWADAPSGMPEVTSQDAGKVATVNNSGVWVAANPSGGSELPTPTSADVGKVATVVGETSKGAVIVPEQTNVPSNPQGLVALSDTVPSLFVEGAHVIATVDDVVYEGVVEEITSLINYLAFVYQPDPDAQPYFQFELKDDDTFQFRPSPGFGKGTHTVSLNLASTSVAYGLETPQSGGGVLVVTETDGTLDKTYAEISTAISQGIVYVAHEYGNVGIIISAEPDVDKHGVVTGYRVWGLMRYSATPSFRDWVASTEDGYPVAAT